MPRLPRPEDRNVTTTQLANASIYDRVTVNGEEAMVVGVENEGDGAISIDVRYDDGEYDVIVVTPPWSTPEGCDHDGAPALVCSHCCPCAECSAIRSVVTP